MVTFYLVRHGQKEGNAGDPHLDNLGKIRAEHTVNFFKNKQIKKIFASPLNRTMETANIIAVKLGLTIKSDNRLRERINWGDKEGESYDEFWKEWQKTDLDRDYRPTNGYSSKESGRRMESFLNDVSKNIKNGAVLVVTSGGIIGDLLRNMFPEKDLPLVINKKSKARYIEILECSVTIIKKDKNFILEKIGDTSHLSISPA
jgi:broad specificity phosphatase PhoE